MALPSFTRPYLLVLLLSFTSFSLAAVVPNVDCNRGNADAGNRGSRHCETVPVAPRAWTVDPGYSLNARPKFPDPYFYQRRGQSRAIVFSDWGEELPNFDDVITVLDRAEAELEREPIHQMIARRRKPWIFQSARLTVENRYDSLNVQELLAFLQELRLFGVQYGFWSSEMDFHDSDYTGYKRGKGYLEWAKPKSVGKAAE